VEGQTQIYRLEDSRGDIVQLLVQWLYTQKFIIEFDPTAKGDGASVAVRTGILQAVRLWVLADKLILPSLQNQALDWIYHALGDSNIFPGAPFTYVYNHTTAGSPLRRFFLWKLTCHPHSAVAFTRFPNSYPKEMLLEFTEYCCANMVPKSQRKSQEDFHLKVRQLVKHQGEEC
jgi:hypothetical protein